MSEPVPADFAADLEALEQRQALLHKALAAFQAGIPEPQPLGFYGLALYHRMAWKDGAHSIEAVLVHSAGGEIASGFLPAFGADALSALQKVTANLLISAPTRSLPVEFSEPQQSKSPIPCPNPCPVSEALPLQEEPPAAAAGPEPEPPAAAEAAQAAARAAALAAAVDPNRDNEPEPKPEAEPDEPPTTEEVAAIIKDLDHIFNRRPSAVREVTSLFRAAYDVGPRTPLAKAITTREHVAWLRVQIDPILANIADFEQKVKAGVAESVAQRAA